MPPDLHLDPAALHAVVVGVAALVPVLAVPALDPADRTALARAPGGAALLAEHDRIVATVARTARALDDLADDLRAVAVAVASTEHDAVRGLGAVYR